MNNNLCSKISADPLLRIRHSHRFVAVVIQFLIPLTIFGGQEEGIDRFHCHAVKL